MKILPAGSIFFWYTERITIRYFMRNFILSLAAERLYLAGLFLVPTIFFIGAVPFLPLKALVASVVLFGALILTVFTWFVAKKVSLPLSWLLGAVWFLPLAYFIAALFAPQFFSSLIGNAFEPDTVHMMALFALALTLPSLLQMHKAHVARAFFVIFAASWLLAVFHILRVVIGADIITIPGITNDVFSPLGKWNDVGIFFGLISTIALLTLEGFITSPRVRTVVWATLIVSLFLVAVVNFTLVWIVVGFVALGIVLYRLILAKNSSGSSVSALVVLIIALSMTLFPTSIGGILSRSLAIEQIEARPSWQATLDIAAPAISASPLVGSGPNTFIFLWDQYRPQEVNRTLFWNADFSAGVGIIPTSLITTGFLGFLAWLAFLVAVVSAGVRGLVIRSPSDPLHAHLMAVSYVGGLYMIFFMFVYLPSFPLFLIGASLLGFFAALVHIEKPHLIEVDFREKPRMALIAVFALVVVLVGSAATLVGSGTVFASALTYERSLQAAGVNDLNGALVAVDESLTFYETDQTYRLKSLIHTARLNDVARNTAALPQSEAQERFQVELGASVESGLRAVQLAPQNFRNWQILAGAYQTVVPLNVDGAYEATIDALKSAAERNPLSPVMAHIRAQVEYAEEKTDSARTAISEALALKEDYIPSLLLLAQIELEDGDIDAAIERVQEALVFQPTNALLHFQIGVLSFENDALSDARAAFSRAVSISSEYANARFYLGRTLLRQGERDAALAEFKEVARLNPENTEVMQIIETVTEGGDPFAAVEQGG